MIDLDEKEEELVTPKSVMDEEAKESASPRSKMGSNHVNNTPRELVLFTLFDIEAHKTIDIHKK
jgi:hypothetical protein